MNKWGVFWLCLTYALSAQATRVWPLDDQGTRVLDTTLQMEWDSWAPPIGQPDTLSGRTTIFIQINVSAWQGQPVRIFHRCAARQQRPLRIEWQSHGVLHSGCMQDRERRLVYQGRPTSEYLNDIFELRVQADGSRWVRPDQLDCSFELEMDL